MPRCINLENRCKHDWSIFGVRLANVHVIDRNGLLRLHIKVFKKLEDLDLGCGPGSGRDSVDVFKVMLNFSVKGISLVEFHLLNCK